MPEGGSTGGFNGKTVRQRDKAVAAPATVSESKGGYQATVLRTHGKATTPSHGSLASPYTGLQSYQRRLAEGITGCLRSCETISTLFPFKSAG